MQMKKLFCNFSTQQMLSDNGLLLVLSCRCNSQKVELIYEAGLDPLWESSLICIHFLKTVMIWYRATF